MALLTLTSDIGQQDYLVGAIKGELLKLYPHFRIADISHHLLPFNYPQAAYVARNAIRNFPSHTFHLVLVNLFENKPEQLLLAYLRQAYALHQVKNGLSHYANALKGIARCRLFKRQAYYHFGLCFKDHA